VYFELGMHVHVHLKKTEKGRRRKIYPRTGGPERARERNIF
jgi:hypothetical protein